jgi:hypothetical protein
MGLQSYMHHAVNHSKEFMDKDGNHRNNMEASRRTIKMNVQTWKCNHNVLQEHLFKNLRRNQNIGEIWGSLMMALQEV